MKSLSHNEDELSEQNSASSGPNGDNGEKAKDVSARDVEDNKVPYDDAAERRVRRKIDWNMMPLFFVLCKV